MMIFRRYIPVGWCVLFVLAWQHGVYGAERKVYQEVLRKLTAHPNRLPGSPGFTASVKVLEKVLVRAGLQPHRQTFDTLVPQTKRCVLTVAGKLVGPVYPLAPNGVVPVSTGGKPIQGRLVYLGRGRPEDLMHKPVAGCIALLDFSSRRMHYVFEQGARAVIFLSDPKATQWQVAKHFSTLPAMVPRAYMDREVARKNGLMAPNTFPLGALEISVVWKSVTGINLWTEIAGEPGRIFRLDAEEAICLSAILDTFGTVPDLCPGNRQAANVALLAQVACDLARVKTKRSIFFVFLGSHYASQDGARHFFNAVEKARLDSRNRDPLTEREGYYRAALKDLQEQLDLVADPDFLSCDENPKLFVITRLLRKMLTSRVNSFNYDLRELAFKRRLNPEAEDFAAKEYRWRQEKRVWNDLRRQLSLRKIDSDRAEYISDDVLDWKLLGTNLYACAKARADSLKARVWSALPVALQQRIGRGVSMADHGKIIAALNRILSNTDMLPFAMTERFAGDEQIGKFLSNHPKLDAKAARLLVRMLLDRILDRSVNRVVIWQWSFNLVVAELRADLQKRYGEMDALLQHNLSSQELATRFTSAPVKAGAAGVPKELVAFLNFDFAADDKPWTLNMLGDQGVLVGQMASPGSFLGHVMAMCKVWDSLPERDRQPELLASSLDGTFTPTYLSFPLPRSLPCTAAHAIGVFGYDLVTVGNNLDRDELPSDDTGNLAGLSSSMADFALAMANHSAISLRSTLTPANANLNLTPVRQSDKWRGYKYEFTAKGSDEAEKPASGAIVFVLGRGGMSPIAGHTRLALARINGEGYVFMPRVVVRNISACRGIGFDENGIVNRISCSDKNYASLFYATGGAFFRPFSLKSYDAPILPVILDARNDSNFPQTAIYTSRNEDVVYFDRRVNFKYIGNGVVLLGSIPEQPKGIGIKPDAVSLPSLSVGLRAAADYGMLNRERLEALRQRNIVNDSIERLNAEAESRLDQARADRESGNTASAHARETFALCLGYRTYDPLRLIANDMVSSVVILMLLTIPFAFFMERLLFGFTTIYRQIVGFVGIFLATFVVLYLVHPAFSLADAPIMIFLAFIIILLSSLVIYIVMGKFRHEIKALQGLVSKVHSTQSESSTALASVVIGISGMRNRPLKTFLTATTIVLLTFTILVFSSFTSKLGVAVTYLGKGQSEPRLEVHRQSFLDIPEALVDAMRSEYSGKCDVFVRNACFTDPFTSKQFVVPPEYIAYNPVNSKTVVLSAMLGFQAGECTRNQRLQRLLPKLQAEAARKGAPPIFLSKLAGREVGVSPGDKVKIFGKVFRFAGTFDPTLLQDYANIDGTRALCPDYKATMQENDIGGRMADEQLENALEEIDTSNFIWCSTDLTAVTTYEALKTLGGITNYTILYPKGDTDLKRIATDISRVFRGPVYAQSAAGAEQYFFTRTIEGAGVTEIIVPLLLGGLIIFSSLLGSIVDREREIFTYSALGLSPPDVAALFFAESSVYAVLGGLGGYLLSQVVAKLMNIMAAYGLFAPPEMNFSSLSSIYTILVVMATVILSTIYPALKAGRSANPGIARKWRMPAPQGDRMQFVFPFTVSSTDLTGVLGFIREHFDSHSDASLGSFAAREIEIFRRKDESGARQSLGIRAVLSLAPFDLGVFQAFQLYSRPSDIAGIEEVVIELERLSGSPGVWIRSNRGFIDELRNQFLLWRSLPVQTVEYYRQSTENLLREKE